MWSILYVFILFASVSSDYAPESGSSIDALIQRLQLDTWTHEEAPCLQKMLILLDNVKNHTLWASWIWNANTVPTGNLFGSMINYGNYDQCLKPPWLHTHPQLSTKYCVARLTLADEPKIAPEYDPYGSVEEYLNSPTSSGLPANQLVWGLCVPAACDARGAARLGAALCDVSNCAPHAPAVAVEHCQTAGDTTPYTAGFYVFIDLWNANTVPTGNLFGSMINYGNYDQCLKPPWLHTHPQLSTKYCVARLTLADEPKIAPEYDPYGSVEEYLNSPTSSGLPANQLVWGLCVPAACDARGAARLGAALCDVSNCAPHAPAVAVEHCQTAGDTTPYTAGFYVFITILVSAIITAVVSTFYRMQTPSDEHTLECLDDDHSLQTLITESFDIRRNYADLVKENKHEIRMMNGIRFIVATAVIAIHELFYTLILGIVNTRDFNTAIEGPTGLLLHADVVVDTFFAMSGLLYIKGLLANSYKNQNLFKVLWKRYVRLIGAFSVVIFYLCSVSDFTGSGPHWPQFSHFEPEVCRRTWRKSLLMLSTSVDDMCDLVTWYIPCDYQLGILATVLFYFYKKDRRLGLAAFVTSAVLSFIIPAVLTYWYRLPVVHFANVGKWFLTYRDYWEVSYTYMASYSRAGAYLVGVAMGYLMTLYNPADYRKTVSLFWSIVGIAVSLIAMLCVFSLGWFYLLTEYEPLEAAVVAATNRVVWATAICCIIGVCEYGTVPFVTDLLSLPIFTPLSRLSYGIYMIHPLLIQRRIFAQRGPITFDALTMVIDTFGDLTIATGLSFAMWLFIEAPFINLCNHLLFNNAKSIPSDVIKQNGVHKQNGEIKAKLFKWFLTYRDYWEVSYTYMASYSRAGAYLVGVAMGYLMTLYNPADYRKTVSLFWSIVGIAVSLIAMLCVFSLGWFYLLTEYEPLEAAVVAATNRVVWATAICCIIGVCEYGTVPFVTDLLSLPIFTPLSRLSYGIYMIHPLLIQRRIFAQRGPITFDALTMVIDTFGDLTIATGLSFAMWLFIEAPFINLCNHLLFNK
uniref:Uncharacterized protein n=1 Tax=Heliothis virescens TaxID=7102 RepID=A0A2A4JY64_HELVI